MALKGEFMGFIAGPVQITLGGSLLLAGVRTTGTINIPGATIGMHVLVTPQTDLGSGAICGGYVSSSGTVTAWIMGIISVTPASTVLNVTVWS